MNERRSVLRTMGVRRALRLTVLGLNASLWIGCGGDGESPFGPAAFAAQATSHPIAFASTRGARWDWPDLYVANSDGSDVTLLILGATQPARSWDGTKIAFYRDEDPFHQGGIYIAGADGSHELFVSRGYHPAWSPDGDHIAFSLTCGGGWSKLFLMDVTAPGSEPQPLWEDWSAGAPAWSPDGSMIVASIEGSITTIETSSGIRHQLLDGSYGHSPSWSPDGREIAFLATSEYKEQRIYALTLETGEVRQLIPDVFLDQGIPDYYEDFDVAWGPRSNDAFAP